MATLSHDPLWPRAGSWPAWSPEAPARVSGTPDDDDIAALYHAVLVGVPTYATSLSATSAHLTPDAVREAITRYSDHVVLADDRPSATNTQFVIHEHIDIADAGNIADPDGDEKRTTAKIAEIARTADLLIALGGDNALTVPVAAGAHGDRFEQAGIITLDAHHDLRDGRSNGSPIERLIQRGYSGERIVQIGITDFANSRAYRDRANDYGITVIDREDIERRDVRDIVAQALDIAGAGGGPIHVDFDVDVCDRSVAPACPASLPGGISAYQLRQFVKRFCRDRRVQSIDFAEVDANADAPDQRTVRLVALCVLDALAACAMRHTIR